MYSVFALYTPTAGCSGVALVGSPKTFFKFLCFVPSLPDTSFRPLLVPRFVTRIDKFCILLVLNFNDGKVRSITNNIDRRDALLKKLNDDDT